MTALTSRDGRLPPALLRVAVALLIGSALVSMVGFIVQITDYSWPHFLYHSHQVELAQHRRELSAGALLTAQIVGWVLTVTAITARAALGWAIWRGHRAARLIYTIVAAVGNVDGIVRAGTDPLTYADLAATAAVVALLWLPTSSRFINASTSARRSARNMSLA